METPSPQICSPFSVSRNRSLISTKHSSGLLTPCRQVGLRRKSLKTVTNVSPGCTFVTPKTLKFDSPENSAFRSNINARNSCCKSEERNEPLSSDNGDKEMEKESKSITCKSNQRNNSMKNNTYPSSTGNIFQESKINLQECEKAKKCKYQVEDECLLNGVKSETHSISDNFHEILSQKKGEVKKLDCERSVNKTVSGIAEFAALEEGESEQNFQLLKQTIKEKEERIRRLRLTNIYKKKHDVQNLAALTDKWKKGCQEALQRLLEALVTQGQEINMTDLMEQVGIESDEVDYNPDTEDFD